MSKKFQWLLIAGLLAPVGVVQAQVRERVRLRAPMVRLRGPMVGLRLQGPLALRRDFRGVAPYWMQRNTTGRNLVRMQAMRRALIQRRFARSVPLRGLGRFTGPRGSVMLRLRARGHRSMRI